MVVSILALAAAGAAAAAAFFAGKSTTGNTYVDVQDDYYAPDKSPFSGALSLGTLALIGVGAYLILKK